MELCSKADIIYPTLPKTQRMLDEEYITSDITEYIQNLLKKLTALGAKTAVLTGVSLKKANSALWAMMLLPMNFSLFS